MSKRSWVDSLSTRRNVLRMVLGIGYCSCGFCTTPAIAQRIFIGNHRIICGSHAVIKKTIFGEQPSKEEETVVLNEMWGITGNAALPGGFRLLRFNDQRAAATVIDGERIIYFSKALVADLRNEATKWTARVVLAHEVGHHAASHTMIRLDPDETAIREMEADRFSGMAIARLGGTFEHLKHGFSSYHETGLDGYPSRASRFAAGKTGWIAATRPNEALMLSGYSEEKPSAKTVLKKSGIHWKTTSSHAMETDFLPQLYVEIMRDENYMTLTAQETGEIFLIPLKSGKVLKLNPDGSERDYRPIADAEWKNDPRSGLR